MVDLSLLAISSVTFMGHESLRYMAGHELMELEMSVNGRSVLSMRALGGKEIRGPCTKHFNVAHYGKLLLRELSCISHINTCAVSRNLGRKAND